VVLFVHVGFSPNVVVIDDSASEHAALRDAFPAARVLLCTVHRERAWKRAVTSERYGQPLASGVREFLGAMLREPSEALWREQVQHLYSTVRFTV
jgi:transposase-like protein